jgi:hypothetical protein
MITPADVATYMGIKDTVPSDLAQVLNWATDATNTLITEWCIDFGTDASGNPNPWPAPVTLAALEQAARLVKRRASPEGVAGMGDFGPVRVSMIDPDIENGISMWRFLVFS